MRYASGFITAINLRIYLTSAVHNLVHPHELFVLFCHSLLQYIESSLIFHQLLFFSLFFGSFPFIAALFHAGLSSSSSSSPVCRKNPLSRAARKLEPPEQAI